MISLILAAVLSAPGPTAKPTDVPRDPYQCMDIANAKYSNAAQNDPQHPGDYLEAYDAYVTCHDVPGVVGDPDMRAAEVVGEMFSLGHAGDLESNNPATYDKATKHINQALSMVPAARDALGAVHGTEVTDIEQGIMDMQEVLKQDLLQISKGQVVKTPHV